MPYDCAIDTTRRIISTCIWLVFKLGMNRKYNSMMLVIVLYTLLYLLFGLLGNCDSVSSSSVQTCSASVRGLHYFANTEPRCQFNQLKHVQEKMVKEVRHYHFNWTNRTEMIERVHHCRFNWTNRKEMVEKARDRITHRQKLFLRFKVPVYYPNASLSWKQGANEFETWVWVAATHEYMLFFPHNFNVLSLGTMGIITNNFWEPGGEGEIAGHCDRTCAEFTTKIPRCVLTWKDIQQFMSNVTGEKTEWNYVCLQLDYDIADVILNPNAALPDLFYYWRFLRQLFSRRPYFGIGMSNDDFIQYDCFNRDGILETKELLMNYFVILITAILLWLYSPLLVHYLPSSEPYPTISYPAVLKPTEFHPTYKSPVRFGYFARYLLCYYMEKSNSLNFKSRVRRIVFLCCLFGVSFRFLYTPYWSYQVFLLTCFLAMALIPEFWSVHLSDEHPTHFLDLWEYPKGVFRNNLRKKEYQFLAHCMQERVYLVFDYRFLAMLYNQSFELPLFLKPWAGILACFPLNIVKFILLVCFGIVRLIFAVLYHLAPAFYFYKQLFVAIFKGTRLGLRLDGRRGDSPFWYAYSALISLTSFLFSGLLVVYFMLATMFACYLVAEVTMFTYIGAVLDPSMAFKYVMLVGAVSLVLHKLTANLSENYDELRDQVVEILQKSDQRRHVVNACARVGSCSRLEQVDEADGTFKVLLKIDQKPAKVLLYGDHFATYISRPLLDSCIEDCDPLRRQISFIFVKVLLMTFYLSIAMWIKNVFHKEKEVSNIFTIIQNIAMYFVPNFLQFFADKRRRRKMKENDGKKNDGKKNDVFLRQLVHKAIVAFVERECVQPTV